VSLEHSAAKGNLSALGGEVLRTVPASSTGSGCALTDFSSNGGEVLRTVPASSTGSGCALTDFSSMEEKYSVPDRPTQPVRAAASPTSPPWRRRASIATQGSRAHRAG